MNTDFNFHYSFAGEEANRALSLPHPHREKAEANALLHIRKARSVAEDRGAKSHTEDAKDEEKRILRKLR